MIREVTTSSLPIFITTCLRLSKDSSTNLVQHDGGHDSLLSTVLWTFSKLLPQYPKIFRPFIDQIYELVTPLIAATPSTLGSDGLVSQDTVSETVAQRARVVFVLLSIPSLKTASAQRWEMALSDLIGKTHSTADMVFRGFSEGLIPWVRDEHSKMGQMSLEDICQSVNDGSHWPSWKGIYAGLERLNGQLITVQSFLIVSTPMAITFPVSKVFGLVDRILSIVPPSEKVVKDGDAGTPTKPEIGRDEREAIWAWLPRLHVSALDMVAQLAHRLEIGSVPFNRQLLNHVLWIFEREHAHEEIREVVYRSLSSLLAHCTTSLDHSEASLFAFCLDSCCETLSPTAADTSFGRGSNASLAVSNDAMNTDAYFKNSGGSIATFDKPSNLQNMAASLLSAALVYLPSGFLPFSIRTKIDRTAVLAQNELLLQSSVLNPPSRNEKRQHNSLLPLLSRQFPTSLSTDSLVRPRLPPVQKTTGDLFHNLDQEIDGEESADHNDDHLTSVEDSSLTTSRPGGYEASKFVQDPVANAPIETQPPEQPRWRTPEQEPEIRVPAKREREQDLDGTNANASGGSQYLLPPGDEPDRKRMRDNDQGIFVPPTTEDDLPPRVAPIPSKDPPPASTKIPESSEPLANLRTMKEDLAGDDSDDSSIPPIDPTSATEDDEGDEEDDAS